jgi:hypothetical protein
MTGFVSFRLRTSGGISVDGNVYSGFIQERELLDQLRDHWLLLKDSFPCV